MPQVIGYAAKHAISDLRPIRIERPMPAEGQLAIDILYCGVCHSDVHQVKNEWKNTLYPCMPGHEIVGRVSSVGAGVSKFKPGDVVAVGCMIDSCQECDACRQGLEQYCEKGFTGTYNGNLRAPQEGSNTFGGYSSSIVVRQEFVLRVPGNLDPAGAAPLLCAGVTTWSPLRHWQVGPGTEVGIVGFGGLGQLALKLARAMGARVTVITRSTEKREEAARLGAGAVVVSTEEAQLKRHAGTLDLILSTIPQAHDPNLYLPLLAREGTYVVVGCLVPLKAPLDISKMFLDRKKLGTTLIGSLRETQELLDFCGKHDITSEIRIIPVDQLNDAFAHVDKGDVAYRYVIDMATLKGQQPDESLAAKVGL